MALPGQIEAAARIESRPVGFEYMNRDAILALPPGERQAAIDELVRARRCVLRVAPGHAGELLAMLGLTPLTDEEKAALPQPEPPAAHTAPTVPYVGVVRECIGCHELKPETEFAGRSYRCRACTTEAVIT